MIKATYKRFFILACFLTFIIMCWGCAQKPGPSPTVPKDKLPEIKDTETSDQALIPKLLEQAKELEEQGYNQDALLVYNQALSQAMAQPGEYFDLLRNKILSNIEELLSNVPPSEIEDFSEIKNLAIPYDLFQYWIGHNYAAIEDYPNALTALESFLANYPDHPRAFEVERLIDSIHLANFDREKLGCILPLSGKYKAYGQKALRGIQLAVQDLSKTHNKQFKVVVKDSQSDPVQAARCVEELALENVFSIAGPLITSEQAGNKAQELGIPMISMTQKTDFPNLGDYLFSNFITPEMQVEALGTYIFMELGLKKVAILYPDERYGRRYMDLFWNMVDQFKGEVVGVEAYDGSKTDFTIPLQKLTGEYYPIPEFLKIETQDDQILELDGQKSSSRDSTVANEDRIEIDFQALFIPDAISRINLILPQLAFNDARGMVLLGTNLWHKDSLLTQAKGYNKNAVISDGYFGGSTRPATARFDAQFREIFQEPPGFIDAISFDTANILFTAAMGSDITSREALKELLRGGMIFNGATGRTLFDENGTPHKELFLITVKKGKFLEINH